MTKEPLPLEKPELSRTVGVLPRFIRFRDAPAYLGMDPELLDQEKLRLMFRLRADAAVLLNKEPGTWGFMSQRSHGVPD